MSKLNWEWDSAHDCEVAFHNGYMIKAERDDSPANPFEEWDGNWPIAIYSDGRIRTYDKVSGCAVDEPLLRFSDQHLVFDQRAIAEAIGPENLDDLTCYIPDGEMRWDEDDNPVIPKRVTDAEVLRSWFADGIRNEHDSRNLALYERLYNLLGIPCCRTTVKGYCQGDWVEVLVVATPEACREFGVSEVTSEDLESTADLYGYWAFGDVYGYTLWAPEVDEDGEVVDWVQLDDSCWGFYGDDHAESGLEEMALSALPDEPVMSHDNKLEDA